MQRDPWIRRLRTTAGVSGSHMASTAELGESSLLPAAAVLTAAGLYATLPARFIANSGGLIGAVRLVVPAVAVMLVVALVLAAPGKGRNAPVSRRTLMLAAIAMLALANIASIYLLVHLIVNGHTVNGHELIRAAIHIWCTNVIVFALGYWQLDAGGPRARRQGQRRPPDFLFPQAVAPEFATPGWQTMFLDYVYVSFTNAIAFSPTDAMPLTRRAKMLMLFQSSASLLLLAMVAARAVNILH